MEVAPPPHAHRPVRIGRLDPRLATERVPERRGEAVALDLKGRPWVLGTVDDAQGSDVLLARYSTGGSREVTCRYGSSGWRSDEPSDLAIDDSGRVMVCGTSGTAGGTATAGFALGYSSSGTRRFARSYPRLSPRDTSFVALVPDGAGGAYVCGRVAEPGSFRHRLIVHYTKAGERAWSRSVVNTATVGDDEYAALALCGSDGVTAVGWSLYTADDHDGVAETYRR